MYAYKLIHKSLSRILPKAGRDTKVHLENPQAINTKNKFWDRQRFKLYSIIKLLFSKRFMIFYLDYDSVRETYNFEQMSWFLTTIPQSNALRDIAMQFSTETLSNTIALDKQDSLISEAAKILEKAK